MKSASKKISSALIISSLALAPIIGGGFGELASGILQILIFAAIIFHLASGSNPDYHFQKIPGTAFFVIFLLLTIISAVFSESIYLSLKQLMLVACCIGAFFLSAVMARNSKVATLMLWIFLLSALSICLYSIRSYAIAAGGGVKFWNAILSSSSPERLFGTFLNPGFFSGFLTLSIPITFGVYLATRRMAFIVVAGIAFAIEIMALMLTGTKFGAIATAIGLIVAIGLALVTHSIKRSEISRIVIMASMAIIIVVLFSKPMVSRFIEARSGGSQAHSTTFRIYTWKSTLNMILDNPIFGVGPGAFSIAHSRYTIAGPTSHAHQEYLQIAAESGIPALLALLAGLLVFGFYAAGNIIKEAISSNSLARNVKTESESAGSFFEWQQLLPESSASVVNCAIFGALIGSAIRGLVDSDWHIIGISLPFWILAGALAARINGTLKPIRLKGLANWIVIVLSVVFMALSASFGAGDYMKSKLSSARSAEEWAEIYKTAARISPLNPEYQRESGRLIAIATDDYASAMAYLKKAIKLSPTDAQNYFVAGSIAADAGKTQIAIKYFRKALKYNPKSTQTLDRLAQAYQAEGDIKSAEAILRRILKLEKSTYEQVRGAPEFVDTAYVYAHIYFGDKYLKDKKYSRAIIEYEAAIERLERWRAEKRILEIARATGMMLPQQESELIELLRYCYIKSAEAYRQIGDYDKANSSLKRAQNIPPMPLE